MKTFLVATASGPENAAFLGEFSYVVEGAERHFIVTWLPGSPEPAVTAAWNGRAACFIPFEALAAATGDYVMAGRNVLEQVLKVREAQVKRRKLRVV